MSDKQDLMYPERIEKSIILLRRNRVILDKDLADLYGVETRELNQAVTRNIERFPEDFMIELTAEEFKNLKSQFVTSSWGGTRKLPRAFTEQGVAMLSSVLNSKKAVLVNVEIMRAFVRLRQLLTSNDKLAKKLEQNERKMDSRFKIVFDAIRQLMEPPQKGNRKIGF